MNNNFPLLLESFFTDRLMRQRQASPATIAGYRDTFYLLLSFIQKQLHKLPSSLTIEDLNSNLIVDFLCWLEEERGNSARTRNTRLAAIHSFFKYASFKEPEHIGLIQRVLAIPNKRYTRVPVEYLTEPEIKALLAAPDVTNWNGCRDRALLLLAVQTGLRVSELISLNCEDVVLERGAHVRCTGKGRKTRYTPILKETVAVLRAWLIIRHGLVSNPLFPNARGGRLSRDGVEYLLRKHVSTALLNCPTLKKKRISPHVLRHTAAMELLQHGVDRTVIAMWLGHESLDTVNIYLHADIKMKEEALAKTKPANVPLGRYKPGDKLMTFLKNI